LQWATYYDAADQAGISRIWGGIHPPIDNSAGRRAGAQCGQGVWTLAQKYFDGSITNTSFALAIRSVSPGCEISHDTYRGLFYKLQFRSDFSQPFTDDPAGFVQALNASMLHSDNAAAPQKFFRVISTPVP